MRKIIAGLGLVVALAGCQSDKKEGNLHLTGSVSGLAKGTLYVKKIADTSLITLDSITIDGSPKFETWLNVEAPEMLYLFLDRGTTNSIDDQLEFFAEPGEMNIDTRLDAFYADAKITGSKNQALMDEFRKVTGRFAEENTQLVVDRMRAQRLGKHERLDSISQKQQKLLTRRYLYTVNFALTHRDMEVAPFVALSQIQDVNLKYLDTICKSMTPKVAQSNYGKKLKQFYQERKKIEQ